MAQTKQFKVGGRYSMRSACDHECKWTYKVVSRTAGTVVLQEIRNGKPFGDKARFRINKTLTSHLNAEAVRPHGTYSMAPILSADN